MTQWPFVDFRLLTKINFLFKGEIPQSAREGPNRPGPCKSASGAMGPELGHLMSSDRHRVRASVGGGSCGGCPPLPREAFLGGTLPARVTLKSPPPVQFVSYT